ncbi:uncharacterized protein LOC112906092, partial [Agrilus planipennis]|uniref:Uncharacterized protein LOC112906092 n=1 Tax=Agrilus planipennis TaxID=224129 RepID=A0A7F5RHQ5_AGRPL
HQSGKENERKTIYGPEHDGGLENFSPSPADGGAAISPRQNLNLVLIALAAAAVFLIICIVVAASVLACRRRPDPIGLHVRRRRRRSDKNSDGSDAGFNEGFHRRSSQYRVSMYEQEMEMEPTDSRRNTHRPMPPRNCVLRNTSWHTAEVSCTANEDGGLPQTFVLEVRNSPEYSEPTSVTTLSDQGENSPPLFRVLGQSPVFSLHSLEPDKKYNILVYAENAVGKSDPPVFIPNVQIQQYYSNNPHQSGKENERKTIYGPEHDGGLENFSPSPADGGAAISPRQNLNLVLIALAAAAVFLIICIVVAASVLACRRRPDPIGLHVRRRRRRSDKNSDGSDAGFNEGFHRRSSQYRVSMYEQEMEMEPTDSRRNT